MGLMLRLLVRPRDFASPMTNLTWDHRLPASATSTTMVMMMWRLEHLLLLLSVLFLVTSICAMMMPPLNISATISIQTPITVQASWRSPHLRGEIKTARSVILVLLFPQLVTSMATPMLTSSSLADDVDRITIEAEAARPQPTPVDQASMSSGVNDMSMVEAPASMVTDVQEKIIEADL